MNKNSDRNLSKVSRVVLYVLIVILCFTLIGCEANKNPASSEGLNYSLASDSSGYIVESYTGTSPYVEIPNEYNGLPVIEIATSVFEKIDIIEITIGKNVKSIGWYAFQECKKLRKIYVDKDNEYFTTENDVLFNIDKTVLVKYPSAKTTEEYKIPQVTKEMEYFAFDNCQYLKKITIPDTFAVIEASAFKECTSLETVILPNTITEIGQFAFANCSKLEEINLPDSLLKIGQYAFSNCPSLKEIFIPQSVINIGVGAFSSNRNLTIKCAQETKPSSWSREWNISRCEVLWNQK